MKRKDISSCAQLQQMVGGSREVQEMSDENYDRVTFLNYGKGLGRSGSEKSGIPLSGVDGVRAAAG